MYKAVTLIRRLPSDFLAGAAHAAPAICGQFN
ncbi:hypothetical protein ACVW1A_001521 [Bradyrhizobium sp. LB1.3]